VNHTVGAPAALTRVARQRQPRRHAHAKSPSCSSARLSCRCAGTTSACIGWCVRLCAIPPGSAS